MDKTYHSILRMGDILEENEQTPTIIPKIDPPTPQSPPKKAKRAQKPKTQPPKKFTTEKLSEKKKK